MNLKYAKINLKALILLIFLYNLKIFQITFTQIKIIKNNIFEKYSLRFLFEKNNYDFSQRKDKGDRDSIENCEKIDYQYFVQYITGNNITFNKTKLDKKKEVSNI